MMVEVTMEIGNRGQTTKIIDQVTPPVNIFFSKQIAGPATVTVQGVIDSHSIAIDSATGCVIGKRIGIFSGVTGDNRFFFADITNIIGNVVYFNEPLDFEFKVGSFAICLDRHMNVDGSTTPQIFEVRGPGEGSPLEFELTKIQIAMLTEDPVSLSKFGDIVDGLPMGLVIRQKNEIYHNIITIKSNLEFNVTMDDFEMYQATNPVFGVDGLSCCYKFAGPENQGVAIKLGPGDSVQAIVQDNLLTLLDFAMLGQGHVNYVGE
jgi:hypothetical protein